MEKIRRLFRVGSNYQLIIVNIVFAVTGTLALYLAGDDLDFIGVMHGDVSNVVYWTLRILVIIPVYQILLIVIGTVFGEFSYFWEMFFTFLPLALVKCIFLKFLKTSEYLLYPSFF